MEHFNMVDKDNILAKFSEDKLHRVYLSIPFKNRTNTKTLCIIGQNPSIANEFNSDKTISFLEEQIYNRYPEYSEIIIVNLFSRIDTSKEFTDDLIRPEFEKDLFDIIKTNTDILLILGQAKQVRGYNFFEQFNKIKDKLKDKKVLRLDIEKDIDYPPHPNNPQLLFRKVEFKMIEYII
ncbi:DUF1643 domain-containing protein (plasmid) [Aliarcobacter lanthieri]|uniref:DUF1643 domain-containing protein n=1 Tax=Aliarcobacter lanthieri TaxID=1355374 RepID=UPI003AAD932B